jgi:hypothetical protein
MFISLVGNYDYQQMALGSPIPAAAATHHPHPPASTVLPPISVEGADDVAVRRPFLPPQQRWWCSDQSGGEEECHLLHVCGAPPWNVHEVLRRVVYPAVEVPCLVLPGRGGGQTAIEVGGWGGQVRLTMSRHHTHHNRQGEDEGKHSRILKKCPRGQRMRTKRWGCRGQGATAIRGGGDMYECGIQPAEHQRQILPPGGVEGGVQHDNVLPEYPCLTKECPLLLHILLAGGGLMTSSFSSLCSCYYHRLGLKRPALFKCS